VILHVSILVSSVACPQLRQPLRFGRGWGADEDGDEDVDEDEDSDSYWGAGRTSLPLRSASPIVHLESLSDFICLPRLQFCFLFPSITGSIGF